MATATLISTHISTVGADQRVYRLDPPYEGQEYVVVSGISGPYAVETYIFPGDETGDITDFGELPGSFRGGVDHTFALKGPGYDEVVS